VHDANRAANTFETLLDERAGVNTRIAEFGVRSVDVPLGDALLQLVSPAEVDTPVQRFLQRKGEGFYNLALEVDDLDGAIRELAALGIKVSAPVEAEPGLRSAFVTMTATHGLSVQLVEIARAEGEPDIEPVTRVEQPRAEHLAPEDGTAVETTPSQSPPLDLTPDEWSDTD
jgi:hypothetical protein